MPRGDGQGSPTHRKATPPKGVIMPSLLTSVTASSHRLPENRTIPSAKPQAETRAAPEGARAESNPTASSARAWARAYSEAVSQLPMRLTLSFACKPWAPKAPVPTARKPAAEPRINARRGDT